MNFNYYMPTKILFGRGKLNELHEQRLPGKKALIVITAGKSIRQNGYLDRVEAELKMAGADFFVYDSIQPNPVKKHIMEAAAAVRDNGCDFVIGLGGGSSIDSAKAIAVMAANTGDYWDYVTNGTGKGLPVKNAPLPIVAITTTAGTGTEADPWSVITNEETTEKIGYGFPGMFPTISIVDPELMLSVPPELTAYQGFDALFHCTEGYINSVERSEVSDMYALRGIKLVAENLAEAYKNGKNIDAREAVALGNTIAGFVQWTSGCTSEHAIEHALSAFHPDLAHGAGLIMISRAYYMHFINAHACDERFIDMAKAMGMKNADNPMDFIAALDKLQKECGVDSLKMSDYGMKEQDLMKYAKKSREAMACLYEVDPVQITDEDCLNIIKASYK